MQHPYLVLLQHLPCSFRMHMFINVITFKLGTDIHSLVIFQDLTRMIFIFCDIVNNILYYELHAAIFAIFFNFKFCHDSIIILLIAFFNFHCLLGSIIISNQKPLDFFYMKVIVALFIKCCCCIGSC